MSKKDKLLRRLFTRPSNFKWSELCSLLKGLGFQEVQGSGARVKFYHPEENCLISLHKPHPGNELPAYAVDQVIQTLESIGVMP